MCSLHARLLVLDLVLREEVVFERDFREELCRAEIAADRVLGVRMEETDVVLQRGNVGVILVAVGTLAVPGSRRGSVT